MLLGSGPLASGPLGATGTSAVSTSPMPPLPPEPGWLQQIVEQLASEAAQATPQILECLEKGADACWSTGALPF
jgi:hypothetical protein